MFSNLGRVIEIVSDTELKVYNIIKKEEVIVTASKEYVSSIKVELNSEDEEEVTIMVVEYDLETKEVNEDIEEKYQVIIPGILL